MENELRAFDSSDAVARVADTELAPAGAEIRLVEWTDPGNPAGASHLIAPVHVHWEDDETWYVLEGALRLLLNDRVVTLAPGGAATAVRGVRHTFWNPSPAPCRYLIATTPRIRDLITALHAGDGRDQAEVYREHASELFGWELPEPLVRVRLH
ncbi:MAG: cupin domain-containing protein [Promicromonosporaceae bacterium]|nr:cupin domain-containing protein [Promicromonosporaceae bacterium]